MRRVVGDSMLPAFAPGRIILGFWPWRVRVGDVVIIRHAGMDKVKRVKDLSGDHIFVLGDNAAASTDSRDFGWIDRAHILAKVLCF